MNSKGILLAGGVAALCVGLIALPGTSKQPQEAPQTTPRAARPAPTPVPPETISRMRIMRTPQAGAVTAGPEIEPNEEFEMALEDEGGSWLGVETQEVTAERAKDLKLSAERGVVIGKVLEESPAAKAGLKDGDVTMEINGQRVEGTVQFRRRLRE